MVCINENVQVEPTHTVAVISKYTRGYYMVDTDIIKGDIANYTEMYRTEKDKKTKAVYGTIVNYLKDLLSNVVDGRINAYWSLNDCRLQTVPFEIQNMKSYGLDSTDYILKKDDRTVVISYKDLWNAMAIILAHRDLELDTKEIDIALSDNGCRLKGVNDIDILIKSTGVINAYNEACQLKICDTPYCRKGGRSGYKDYFGHPIKTNNYKDLIDSSINRVMTFIITECLEKLSREDRDDVEFLGIFEDNIYYNTSMDTETIKEKLAIRVGIRLFGRLFEITPTIEIY